MKTQLSRLLWSLQNNALLKDALLKDALTPVAAPQQRVMPPFRKLDSDMVHEHLDEARDALERDGTARMALFPALPLDAARAREALLKLLQSPDERVVAAARTALDSMAEISSEVSDLRPWQMKMRFPYKRMPQAIPGVLRDLPTTSAELRTLFIPADESFAAFEVDAAAVVGVPRGEVLFARATNETMDIAGPDGVLTRIPLYQVHKKPTKVKDGTYFGIIDVVDGKPMLRVRSPEPGYIPLSRATGATQSWAEGTVLHVDVVAGAVQVKQIMTTGDTALSRVYAIADSERLLQPFPAACMQEAEAIAADLRLDDEALVDLTHEPFFAIDNPGSRDIDQAMHVQRKPGGGFILSYALADLAAYVKPGMALWNEALKRGASYYLPGLSVPMQPFQLCEGAVSLNAHEDHRAIVLRIEMDADGNVTGSKSLRAKIHSQAQLTYAGVSAFLTEKKAIDVDEHERPVPQPVLAQLDVFAAIGQARRSLAKARGVVEPERRDMEIALKGDLFALRDSKELLASQLNAEISIVSNVVGAEMLKRAPVEGIAIPGVFRTHPPPAPWKERALKRQLSALVKAHGLGSAWFWKKGERLTDYVERLKELPTTPASRDLSRILQSQTFGLYVSACYEAVANPHEGLRLDAYGRFTAPMREVVGMFSHAVLGQRIALERMLEAAQAAGKPIAAADAALLWDHLLLAALVDTRSLAPERAAVVARAAALSSTADAKLLAPWPSLLASMKSLGALTDKEVGYLDHVQRRVVNAGNAANVKQSQVDTASIKLLFDDLFFRDLHGIADGDPSRPPPLRKGRVSLVTPSKIHVQLSEPDVEVRITADDVKQWGALQLVNDAAAVSVGSGDQARTLWIGTEVDVKATHHDGDKLHFTLA